MVETIIHNVKKITVATATTNETNEGRLFAYRSIIIETTNGEKHELSLYASSEKELSLI